MTLNSIKLQHRFQIGSCEAIKFNVIRQLRIRQTNVIDNWQLQLVRRQRMLFDYILEIF